MVPKIGRIAKFSMGNLTLCAQTPNPIKLMIIQLRCRMQSEASSSGFIWTRTNFDWAGLGLIQESPRFHQLENWPPYWESFKEWPHDSSRNEKHLMLWGTTRMLWEKREGTMTIAIFHKKLPENGNRKLLQFLKQPEDKIQHVAHLRKAGRPGNLLEYLSNGNRLGPQSNKALNNEVAIRLK